MSLATTFARALVPAAMLVTPVAAPASPSTDMNLVKAHLHSVNSMTANFAQTDSKRRTLSGTLQLKRPGKIRFQYGGGVDVLLVANGKTLTFVDYEVGQKSSWDLNKTPLGILLADNPNLDRIAKIAPSKDPRVVVVNAVNPSHREYGRLVLAFIREASSPGGLKLYGWTAIDAQGKQNVVKLSNQRYNVAIPGSAFTYAEPKKKGR